MPRFSHHVSFRNHCWASLDNPSICAVSYVLPSRLNTLPLVLFAIARFCVITSGLLYR